MKQCLRVLIVEDTEADAQLLLRELRRGGFDVISTRVETASAMKKALDENVWDLVVSDYSMPAFDVPRALAILRESGRDLPFIVVSGTVGEDSAVDALKAGAHDFIVKGKLARLLPAVERELREVKVREAGRQSERALRESEERYRQIIETTNEGVWLLDSELKTTFVNRRVTDLLGFGEEGMLGKPILDFAYDECRAALGAALGRREVGATGQVEVRLKRNDGTDVWGLLDSKPLFDAEGQFRGALTMMMDVTARKRLEDQLRQTQKMEAIGSLAGGVAHDFNNLLSVVLSYTTLTIEKLDANDPMRADLEEVKKAGDRAAELTRQLLAFSRRQVLELRILDLNQVLTGLEKMLRRLLSEDVELALTVAEKLGKVRADPTQIEQIVLNLVVNARDAMPRGGKITIETSNVDLDASYAASHLGVVPGPYVMMAVSDTGVGMDAETATRIFEPFFTTKEIGKGTGLGLSTVFGIVQQSQGHIWVQSEPDRGTTFRVYLPRTRGESQNVSTSAVAVPLAGTETILLAEDEESVRAVVRTILRANGYNVLDAQNGGEAFLICEQYTDRIHLLITDVIMPRMGGRELAHRLLQLQPTMKVLYISGYPASLVGPHGVFEPGTTYLQKPITPDNLLRKVREVLDRADINTGHATR
jgi:two-component system, cell cycle sensor histidine kinase and response regulator CckA